MEDIFSYVVTKIISEITLHGDVMTYLWEGRGEGGGGGGDGGYWCMVRKIVMVG